MPKKESKSEDLTKKHTSGKDHKILIKINNKISTGEKTKTKTKTKTRRRNKGVKSFQKSRHRNAPYNPSAISYYSGDGRPQPPINQGGGSIPIYSSNKPDYNINPIVPKTEISKPLLIKNAEPEEEPPKVKKLTNKPKLITGSALDTVNNDGLKLILKRAGIKFRSNSTRENLLALIDNNNVAQKLASNNSNSNNSNNNSNNNNYNNRTSLLNKRSPVKMEPIIEEINDPETNIDYDTFQGANESVMSNHEPDRFQNYNEPQNNGFNYNSDFSDISALSGGSEHIIVGGLSDWDTDTTLDKTAVIRDTKRNIIQTPSDHNKHYNLRNATQSAETNEPQNNPIASTFIDSNKPDDNGFASLRNYPSSSSEEEQKDNNTVNTLSRPITSGVTKKSSRGRPKGATNKIHTTPQNLQDIMNYAKTKRPVGRPKQKIVPEEEDD